MHPGTLLFHQHTATRLLSYDLEKLTDFKKGKNINDSCGNRSFLHFLSLILHFVFQK